MLLYWFAFKTNLKQSPVASSPFWLYRAIFFSRLFFWILPQR
jgi:hypothetical protein